MYRQSETHLKTNIKSGQIPRLQITTKISKEKGSFRRSPTIEFRRSL